MFLRIHNKDHTIDECIGTQREMNHHTRSFRGGTGGKLIDPCESRLGGTGGTLRGERTAPKCVCDRCFFTDASREGVRLAGRWSTSASTDLLRSLVLEGDSRLGL